MKKSILFCAFCFVLCAFNGTFAYTSSDLSNAQYLANNAFIKSQKSPELYRLDDMILRQEVIGTALKMKGIVLPADYTCKKYFTDAINNDWVCRAVELAADNGIISRANTKARPAEMITRAEALAILLKTGKVSISVPRRVTQTNGSIWSLFEDLKGLGFTQWQADMLDSLPDCTLINHGVACEDGASTNQVFAQFQPNRVALRSMVFEFGALMVGFRAGDDDLGFILDDLGVFINTSLTDTIPGDDHMLSYDDLKKLFLGEPLEANSKAPEIAVVVFSDFECPFCVRYFQDVVSPLLTDTNHNIALVYKHFPLSFHPNAYTWAIESECIRKNLGDKAFFGYIRQRYASQEATLSVLSPSLTKDQMDACLLDQSIAQDISSDQKLGSQYKVFGTPTTLVINMKTGYYETIEGSYPRETVEETIQTVKAHT